MCKVTSKVVLGELYIYLDDSKESFYSLIDYGQGNGGWITRNHNLGLVPAHVRVINEPIADHAAVIWLDNVSEHGPVKTGYMVAEWLNKAQVSLLVVSQ